MVWRLAAFNFVPYHALWKVNDVNDTIEHVEAAMQTFSVLCLPIDQAQPQESFCQSFLSPCSSAMPLLLRTTAASTQNRVPSIVYFPALHYYSIDQVQSENGQAVWSGLIGQSSDGKAYDLRCTCASMTMGDKNAISNDKRHASG